VKLEIKIPMMGESISEATISSILKQSGSYVKQDEEILELETDKVNQVLYAPASGVITLAVAVGVTVKIGQVIGSIETEGEKPAGQESTAPKKEAAMQLPPTGGSARQMPADFIANLSAPKVAVPPKTAPESPPNRRKMSSLRKTIAQKLVDVKNETAMLTTFNEVDMTRIMEIRAQEKDKFQSKQGVKLGFMSFFIKACTLALKEFPDVGAFIEGDEIVGFEHCHIGVAVSTEKGLMVPVIKNCEKLSYGEIEKALDHFAKKAREGQITFDELKGGIFTITNGGVFGSLLSTPILNPPQSAILGMHAIVKRPVAINDQVVICPMMYLALSYDHRIIDGKEAVQFLVKIKETLENPSYEI
jgi:2-oxoglutarate dehydrogenase E2 component (dihydrolipoamide succinyltransferase)